MASGRVLLVRHPQTEANLSQRFVGRGESPYTELGRRQAEDLIVSLSEWRADRVYSSPRRRALDVASPASGCGVPLIVRDELAEVDFGPAEGMTYAEMDALSLSADHLWLGPRPGAMAVGETWEQLVARVRVVAEEVIGHGGRTAVVAHGGVIRAFVHLWMGVPRESVVRFTIGNATAAQFVIDDGWVALHQFGAKVSDLG